jgi:hypothetical protein
MVRRARDAEVSAGQVLRAERRNEKGGQAVAAEGDVRRHAQRDALPVLHERLDDASGADPQDRVWRVAGDVEDAVSIKRDSVRDVSRQAVHDLGISGRPPFGHADANDPRQVREDDVEERARGVQGDSVGKARRSSRSISPRPPGLTTQMIPSSPSHVPESLT